MRILLVDDEPRLLGALRRILSSIADGWEVSIAEGGDAALKELARAPYDVVVSDMRMPGMDGAALLAAAQREYPGALRIMLSGQTEPRAALRAVRVAHRFFTKPCTAQTLAAAIERIQRRLAPITSARVRTMLTSISQLPSITTLRKEMSALVEQPGADAHSLARAFRRDVALTAKLLQVANSSFFESAAPSTSLRSAISRLGLDVTAAVIADERAGEDGCGVDRVGEIASFRAPSMTPIAERSSDASASCAPSGRPPAGRVSDAASLRAPSGRPSMGRVSDGPSLSRPPRRSVYDRSYLAALIASAVSTTQKDDAFMAALFSDVGRLLLTAHVPDLVIAASSLAKTRAIPMHAAEREIFGATSSEIGAALLEIWGLPDAVVEAVANQNAPQNGMNGLDAVVSFARRAASGELTDVATILGRSAARGELAGRTGELATGEVAEGRRPSPSEEQTSPDSVTAQEETVAAWRRIAAPILVHGSLIPPGLDDHKRAA